MSESKLPAPGRRFGIWGGILIGIVTTSLVLLLIAGISFLVMGRCPMCGMMLGRDGWRGRMMGEEVPGWMMSRGMMSGQMMQDMRTIRLLLEHHEQIAREVEDIPGGIRATTTSDDPEVVEAIRTHVRQMEERIERGAPIRMMDPLFREIFQHHDQITMVVEEVPGGVRVTETSEDPQVQRLIRQHAHRAVSEFVESGMRRAMRPTPLPEDY